MRNFITNDFKYKAEVLKAYSEDILKLFEKKNSARTNFTTLLKSSNLDSQFMPSDIMTEYEWSIEVEINRRFDEIEKLLK